MTGTLWLLVPICYLSTIALLWRMHRPPRNVGELHRLSASDGWPLTLTRYAGDGSPVLLCHGISSSAGIFRLTGDLSGFLQQQGYDVWCLDLRGHGMSKRSPLGSRWLFDRWGFHDYVIRDAPAAVAYILQTTGASGLHWVGHSMGGMVGICARSQGMEGLKSIITLGSPSFEKENRFTSGGALAVGGFFLRWFPVMPTRLFFFLIWPLLALWGPPSRIYCRPNLGRRELGGLIAGAYDDLSGGELRDLLAFRAAGRLSPYADWYDRVGLPVLSIIGNEDRVVSPEDAEMFAHLLPGSVGCRILSGCGHADLVAGRQAPETVFVRIAGFLGDVESKKRMEV